MDDNANRAIKKSRGMPEIFVFTIGTYASGTPWDDLFD